MKTSKIQKSTSSNSHSSKPFFNKSGEGGNLSENQESERPFFKPNYLIPNPSISLLDLPRVQKQAKKAKTPKDYLKYEELTKVWSDKLASAQATGDCVKACHLISREIGKLIKGKVSFSPIKSFKYDVERVKGNENSQAVERFKKGKKDILGSEIIVYSGYSRNLKREKFKLKPGMLVYTSEWTEWLKEKDSKGEYIPGKYVFDKKTGKQLEMWSQRHMRMYVGRGEFRDKGGRTHGNAVWGDDTGKSQLYVVLAVYDPFAKYR